MSKDTDRKSQAPAREFWEEYERRKAKIQNVGLTCAEYDRAVAQILEDLDSESDD